MLPGDDGGAFPYRGVERDTAHENPITSTISGSNTAGHTETPVSAKTLFDRLDRSLARRRKKYYRQLRPGLSEAQLDAFEAFVGYAFPERFRALYRWRDGQSDRWESLDTNR